MPQILWVASRRKIPAVSIVTAGEDQNAICVPAVYLEAVIDGSLLGHTAQWEQVSGSPIVELLSVGGPTPNPLLAYYLVPGLPGTDKVFRFVIDKGTSSEQSMTVTIRTTPSTYVKTFDYGRNYTEVTPPYYALPSAFRQTIGIPFDNTIPFNSLGARVTSPYEISWGLPELFYEATDADRDKYRERFVATVAQKWEGTTWGAAVVVDALSAREIAVMAGDKVRIGAIYSRIGKPDEVVFNPWFEPSGSGVAGYLVVGQHEYGKGYTESTVSRLVYRLVTVTYSDDNIIQPEYGRGFTSEQITRLVYRLVMRTDNDEATQPEYGRGWTKFTINRATGGGSIGG